MLTRVRKNVSRYTFPSLPQHFFTFFRKSFYLPAFAFLILLFFRELTNLRKLHLEFNELKSVDGDVFQGLTSLTHLYLTYNQLTYLPNGVFKGLHNLQYLYLYENKITKLQKGVFQGLKSLKKLCTLILFQL